MTATDPISREHLDGMRPQILLLLSGLVGSTVWGGLENGVGLIKADDRGSVGATMLTRDDQSCVLVTLMEVPCDIRAPTANCFGVNKTKTSVSSSADVKAANASMPIDGSGVSGLQ